MVGWKQDASSVSVYVLTFPGGKQYVGVSHNPTKRIREHEARARAESKQPSALTFALRKYGVETVGLEIVKVHRVYERAFQTERRLIKKLGTLAPGGYNMTAGGEGVVGLPLEIRQAAGRKYSEKYRNSPDVRARARRGRKVGGPKISAKLEEWWASEASADLRRSRSSPEFRKKISEACRNPSQVIRKKLASAAKALWQDPEYRAKVNAARDQRQAELSEDPEWRAKRKAARSASMKAKWQDPEYIARRKASLDCPEVRRKMSEGSKRSSRPTGAVEAERRRKCSEATKKQWNDPVARQKKLDGLKRSRESKKRGKQPSTILR